MGDLLEKIRGESVLDPRAQIFPEVPCLRDY